MADLSRMLSEIVKSEPDAMAWTNEVAEPFVVFAQNAFEIFSTAVTHTIDDCLLFRGAYSHTRKMAGLAVLSALRQHRIENGLNLRQVIEGTSLMGYLAAHPGYPGDLAKPNLSHQELVTANEKLMKTAFKWMTETHPVLDGDLRFYKGHINRNRSHVTVMATASVYDYRDKDGVADQRFYDAPDPLETRATLLATGNIINLASGMLILTSQTTDAVTVRPKLAELVNHSVHQAIALRETTLSNYDDAGR